MDNTAAKKDYTAEDCFQVTLPENWNVNTPISLNSRTPDGELQIWFSAHPLPPIIKKPLDQWVNDYQKSVITSKDRPAKLEESGSLYIDTHEAKWSLFSHEPDDEKPTYYLHYTIFSNQYVYMIGCHGLYSNLENDRKTINEVISSFKILK